MLVLVSFGLVLLATILLVVGLLTDDGLNLIYLSIACSATAAVVLYLAFRQARPSPDGARTPPAPIIPDGVDPDGAVVAATAPAPSADATTVQPAVARPDAEGADAVNPGGTPTAATAAAVAADEDDVALDEPAAGDDDWVSDDDWADAGEFEVEFPIADYDDLDVDEILPLLPQLYSDELEVVAERERSTKNRAPILARLDELAASGTEADALEAAAEAPAAEAPAEALVGEALPGAELADAPNPGASPTADTEPAVATPAPAAASAPPAPARPAPAVPSLSDDDWDDEVPFPIADYDTLRADQVMTLLPQLEPDELEDVRAREAAGQGRKSVLTEIDRLRGVGDGDAAWRAEPPAATPVTDGEPDARPAPDVASPDGSLLAIAGYDGLTVNQIRPLLGGLSHAELRALLEHEVARDNRRTIVNDIERRLSQPEGVPSRAAGKATARKTPATRTAKSAARAGASKAATAKVSPRKAPVRKAAKKAAAPPFPIAGYEALTVAQVRPLLGALSRAELELVREREVAGASRRTILADIDRLLRSR